MDEKEVWVLAEIATLFEVPEIGAKLHEGICGARVANV
jgi:hypothetical protein